MISWRKVKLQFFHPDEHNISRYVTKYKLNLFCNTTPKVGQKKNPPKTDNKKLSAIFKGTMNLVICFGIVWYSKWYYEMDYWVLTPDIYHYNSKWYWKVCVTLCWFSGQPLQSVMDCMCKQEEWFFSRILKLKRPRQSLDRLLFFLSPIFINLVFTLSSIYVLVFYSFVIEYQFYNIETLNNINC